MRKSLQAFVLAIGLLMALLVAAQNQLVPASVAHSGNVLSAWAKTTPQIDGLLRPSLLKRVPYPDVPYPHPAYMWIATPGEWDDAAKVDFTLTYGSPSESHPATLWVKNDYINLYLAVQIRNEEYHSDDLLYLNFDNSHNGVREAGDDQLGSWGGIPWFLDNYWVTSSSSTLDSNSGGTSDGAGFAQHTASTSTWVFEMVHPLNTNDDSHDFSLSIGNTVGINVLYFDHLGSIGSASWPSPNWAQMADIVIAGPPAPPSSSVDLSNTVVEVVQAVQDRDSSLLLVRNKATVVRVYTSIGPTSLTSVTVTAFLYGVDGNGKSLGALSQSFDAPKNPLRSATTSSTNFLLPMSWVSGGSLTLKAFVKASATTQGETNYNNNWMAERSFTLSTRVVPTIYIVPVNLGTAANPDIVSDKAIAEAKDYLKTVYPVSDVNFVQLPWEVLGENAPNVGDALNELLTHAGYDLGLQDRGINQIYGITPRGAGSLLGISTPYWPTIPDGHSGFFTGAAIAASGTCIIGYDYTYGTMAHEINHNLGPGVQNPPDVYRGWGLHTWNDQDWPGYNGYDPWHYPYDDPEMMEYGFDTRTMQVVDYDTPDFQSYSEASTKPVNWISPYRWQNLFNRMSPWVLVITIPHLVISGWIAKNGTGSLGPVFPVPSNQSSPSAPGNYSLVFRNINGSVLLTHTFQPQFGDVCGEGEHDPDYFVKLLPYVPSTAEVGLYSNATLLAKILKTPHTPTVQMLSPNGGEIWNATEVRTISWTASDLDNDTLTYRVYYSPDNGTTWTPLSPNIKGLSYKIDPSHLQASNQARIKVVATDGINMAEAISHGSFRLLNHPPTAEIVCPYETDLWFIGMTIPFRGTGTDPDEMLPESAFSWTSDLDGFLGNGRNLPIVLSGGVHYVTLTVTDSQSATATDTIQVTVIPDISGGYPFPQIPSLFNQTAAGQGYTAKIKMQVGNPGPIIRSFNVTASANGNPFQTIPILNLPSGNSTYLEFLWNTAGKPKGVYNITAVFTLPEYFIIQLLGTIQISAIGDITGPTARVPDGKVDIRDLATMAKIYGVIYPDARYDPNCDLTGPMVGVPDDKIDIRDLAAAAKNYGKIDP